MEVLHTYVHKGRDGRREAERDPKECPVEWHLRRKDAVIGRSFHFSIATRCSFSVWVTPGGYLKNTELTNFPSEKLSYLSHLLTDLSHTCFPIISSFIFPSFLIFKTSPYGFIAVFSFTSVCLMHLLLTFCFCCITYFLYLTDYLSDACGSFPASYL